MCIISYVDQPPKPPEQKKHKRKEVIDIMVRTIVSDLEPHHYSRKDPGSEAGPWVVLPGAGKPRWDLLPAG